MNHLAYQEDFQLNYKNKKTSNNKRILIQVDILKGFSNATRH